ncbi:MAG: imidazoleglycerol-phosphate dehydratase HisB [Promethearchaeota archaeon]
MGRTSTVTRKTKETSVSVKLNLDGEGAARIEVPYGFLRHALELLSKHSRIDLELTATGDLSHHVVEDAGIVLGEAFKEALGDKAGIRRFGSAHVPMDDALARCVVDLSGRAHAVVDLGVTGGMVEDTPLENFPHFFESFAHHCGANVHLHVLYGQNVHHVVEACFKALALALREAIRLEGGGVPSTKGVL